MNVRVTVLVDQGLWRAQLSLQDGGMTREERASLVAHGPFSVDAGGTFTGDDCEDLLLQGIDFELDVDTIQLPTDFPVVREFAAADSLDVEIGPRAAIWAETMLQRINSELVNWLELGEIWERDTVHTLPSWTSTQS